MNTVSVEARPASLAGRTLFDRALAAIPALLAGLMLVGLYGVEAWLRKTPWVFTDELEWSQISRAIAATGHPARRGQPIYFKSLYAYLIAPCWWIHSTAGAYAAIKYLNAIVMTLAAVPTYLLARMLVSRRAAAVVAVLAVTIPAMSYTSSIVPEVLGYTWYAVCSWLIVRALTTKRWLDIGVAGAASFVAILIRAPQFFTVAASFGIAAAGLWLTGPRGRALRSGWSRRDTIGAIVLFAGALVLFNRVVLQHIHEWQISTQYWKPRMVDLGLKAGLALTVGMGILPVIGGLASLRLPERRADPRYRAFAAYLAATIFCVSLYTGVKAAYISTVFSTLTEERNMIYLSPLLLIGTALVFESRRIDWRIVAAASAFVVFLIYTKPFQLLFPYFEAPGFAILTIPTRHWSWTVEELRLVLLGVLALSLLALAYRRLTAVAGAVAVLGAAWMLTSQIATTVGSVHFAHRFMRDLPSHANWIDLAVHGQPVTYIGQEIKDPNVLLLTEFWNRQIKHVDSLDGSAPGPGPTYAPSVVKADGELDGLAGVPFIVADHGVTLQAKVVEQASQLTLYRRTGPWRLLDAFQQVYTDSWAPGWSTYTYFRVGQRGTLQVSIGRVGYNGDAAPGHALLKVGTVKIVGGQAVLDHVFTRRRTLVRDGSLQVFDFPVARTPVRIEIFITPTFRAAGDPRDLGAQVGFKFLPAKHG
jgi:hypothetical protein